MGWVKSFAAGGRFAVICGVSFLGIGFALEANASKLSEYVASQSSQSWESTLPLAQEIKAQGKYPYCTLFAASTYLELWGTSQRAFQNPLPSLDPAYLAVSYNLAVGSGAHGTKPLWLLAVVQEYGIIPRSASIETSDNFWPLGDWKEAHQSLMPASMANLILMSSFRSPDHGETFSGKAYVENVVRFRLSELVPFRSVIEDDENEWFDAQTSEEEEVILHPTYRIPYAKLSVGMKRALKQNQVPDWTYVEPQRMYHLAVQQLSEDSPVLVSVNARATRKRLRTYDVISPEDVETGRTTGRHTMVAVGHCDKTTTSDPLCERFGETMREERVKECIVLQNSWGENSNSGGYVCVSPIAWNTMIRDTYVWKKVVN
jgi:hypothetical protein